MPIQSPKNQYLGVNAHLNSYLQNTAGEWASFHAAHIVDLARALSQQLPHGYFARIEKSLQIRESSALRTQRPRPDVTVFARPPVGQIGVLRTATPPTTTARVIDTTDLTDDDYLSGVVIYTNKDDQLGRPVTRLELLSPTNKPPGEGYWFYREKRYAALRSGVPLIEIDYLHETASPLHNIPDYPAAEDGSSPYNIAISDPRPSFEKGPASLYLFGIDNPIPTIPVPLAGDTRLIFDLQAVYDWTFGQTPFYHSIVDYAKEPLAFTTYHPTDQERIRRRMAWLAQPDLDLAQGPFALGE